MRCAKIMRRMWNMYVSYKRNPFSQRKRVSGNDSIPNLRKGVMVMTTIFAKVKASSDDTIHIPQNLLNLCEIQEDSEVLIYGAGHRIILSIQPLSEEELTDIDMMQWSMDIDERIKCQDKELLSSGILTEEDFV